jgi:hypothetical protein
MGDNIPGKPRQALFYLGGIPNYYKRLNEEKDSGYKGFELSREKTSPRTNERKEIRSKI